MCLPTDVSVGWNNSAIETPFFICVWSYVTHPVNIRSTVLCTWWRDVNYSYNADANANKEYNYAVLGQSAVNLYIGK